MADAIQLPDEAETRARWGNFAWTAENAAQVQTIIGRYPKGRQQSAVMSASMWPFIMKSIACKWLNAVGRILQR